MSFLSVCGFGVGRFNTPGQTDCFKIMNWCWAIFTHCLVITTKFMIAEVKSIYICTRTYCTESEILLGCKVFLFQPRHVHSVNWLIYTDLTEIIVLKTMFTKASCACGICTISPFLWWRHQMDTFTASLTLSRVTSEFTSQRPVTRILSLIWAWTNGWVSNRGAGNVTVIMHHLSIFPICKWKI